MYEKDMYKEICRVIQDWKDAAGVTSNVTYRIDDKTQCLIVTTCEPSKLVGKGGCYGYHYAGEIEKILKINGYKSVLLYERKRR